MTSDRYTKIVLTIIAACLVVITIRALNAEPTVKAAASMSCTGEIKANAWGGVQATIGGYALKFTCE